MKTSEKRVEFARKNRNICLNYLFNVVTVVLEANDSDFRSVILLKNRTDSMKVEEKGKKKEKRTNTYYISGKKTNFRKRREKEEKKS